MTVRPSPHTAGPGRPPARPRVNRNAGRAAHHPGPLGWWICPRTRRPSRTDLHDRWHLHQQARVGLAAEMSDTCVVREGVAVRDVGWGRAGYFCHSLRLALLVFALWPDHGFTRGRATPRQVQWYACRNFPNCRYKPVREYRGRRSRTTFPLCPDHNVLMDEPVVWKPRA